MNWDNDFTHDEHCLRSHIQRFIVQGGDCPLQRDKKGEDEEEEDKVEDEDYEDDG